MLFINDVDYEITTPRSGDGIMFAGIHVTDGDNAAAQALVVPPVWYWHAVNPKAGFEQDQDDFRLVDSEGNEVERSRTLDGIEQAMIAIMEPFDEL
jgi:hypothetical protein